MTECGRILKVKEKFYSGRLLNEKIIFSFLGAVIGGLICSILFWSVGSIAVALDIRLITAKKN